MRKVLMSILMVVVAVFGAGEPVKYLTLGVDARALAMGGAGIATVGTPWAPFYNPASVSARGNFAGAASNQFLDLGRKLYGAAISAEIYEEAGVGLVWIHSGVDDVPARNSDGELTGTVANGDDAIFFAFGKNFKGRFHLGFGVEYFESSIENVTVSTAGFGAGLSWRMRKPNLTLGLALQNLFMKFLWNSNNYYGMGQTVEEEIPPLVRAGAEYAFRLAGMDCSAVGEVRDYPSLGDLGFGAGIEISPLEQISLRAGFNGEHPTFGVGVSTKVGKLSLVGINYAFVPENYGLSPRHIVDLVVEY